MEPLGLTDWIEMDDRTNYKITGDNEALISSTDDVDLEEEALIAASLGQRLGGTWSRRGEWNPAELDNECVATFVRKEITTRIILDNGGGITLQLGDWAHAYGDAAQAATDVREWLASGTTRGWEGHEDAAASVAPTPDDIRNGGFFVVTIDRSSDTTAGLANEMEDWGRNGQDLAAALRSDGNGRLCDYATTDVVRNATAAEQADSREAAKRDGGRGVIEVDGRSCYVED